MIIIPKFYKCLKKSSRSFENNIDAIPFELRTVALETHFAESENN